jgi:hypothetical protein
MRHLGDAAGQGRPPNVAARADAPQMACPMLHERRLGDAAGHALNPPVCENPSRLPIFQSLDF